MNARMISQNDWIFTDSRPEDFNPLSQVHAGLNTRFGFQILLDGVEGDIKVQVTPVQGLTWEIGQMQAVGVDENTGPKIMTTRNYEECKAYVTRQAPFYVYDCILDYIASQDQDQRVLYIRGRVAKEAERGKHEVEVRIKDGKEEVRLKLEVNLYPVLIPDVNQGKIGQMNFFSFDLLEKLHQVKPGDQAYDEIFKKYLRLQLELGQTHIMLPLAKAIRDQEGKLVNFDFSKVVRIADLALEAGAKYIVGAGVSHWDRWNGNRYHLLWDKEVDVCSSQGYLQLKCYYQTWARIVDQKGYLPYLYHSLADEPQVGNALQYRALAALFRRFMPMVPLIEAVEAIELGGALDVWVPKGETFERWERDYRKLMEGGEKFWYYTCAFPAGPYMNRSMDLPAVVSRYLLWMVVYYGMNGYLHWGFNYYKGPDIWHQACCPRQGGLLPAGDAHIVYSIGNQVYPSLRLELQREGRDEAEAFYLLKDRKRRKDLISQAVRGQNDYQRDSRLVEEIKKDLFEAIMSQQGQGEKS